MKIKPTAPRKPLSHIPADVCTRMLTGAKISNRSRKLFSKARGKRIEIENTEPKTLQDKYCAKLKTLSFHALSRQLAQATRDEKILAGRLKRTDPDSKMWPIVKDAFAVQTYRKSWVEDEIRRRTAPKPIPRPKFAEDDKRFRAAIDDISRTMEKERQRLLAAGAIESHDVITLP